jgi:anti-anti-sigma factor
MEKSLVITQTLKGEIPVLSIAGRLDAANAPEAEQALASLMEEGKRRIVIDAGSLAYISSAGLRVLIAAKKRLSPQGGDIRLAGLQPPVRNVFAIAGFDRIFAIYDDAAAAVQSFS